MFGLSTDSSFKCARTRRKICLFIHNGDKISGPNSPKRFIKITDRFTWTSANDIYCIKCTLYKHLYKRVRKEGD